MNKTISNIYKKVTESIGLNGTYIGDVIDYLEHKGIHDRRCNISHSTKRNSFEDILLELWEYKKLDIEEQNEKCRIFVYKILKLK